MKKSIRTILVLAAMAVFFLPNTVRAARDFSKVKIRSVHVAGNVHMLEGTVGNMGVSVGEDGLLLIDDDFAPLAGKIQAALKNLGKGALKFVLNTHWHGDHTGGNENLGGAGALIFS